MELFHVIDDAQAVLRSKGVFRQAKVYRRADKLFAGWGSGFVRLMQGGGTSHPNVSWVEVPVGLAAELNPTKPVSRVVAEMQARR